MPVIECDVAAARERLETAGVDVEPGNTDYERWRASRGEASALAYDDKVVIQGRDPRDLETLVREGSAARGARSRPSGGRAHVYFDGGARGNPGPAGIGWVIVTSAGIVAEGSDAIGRATNNQAEYEALIAALEAASDYGYDEVHVRGDSELVVEQIRGAYDTTDPVLREKRVTALELLSTFDEWAIEHVPREVNARADELANEALDGR